IRLEDMTTMDSFLCVEARNAWTWLSAASRRVFPVLLAAVLVVLALTLISAPLSAQEHRGGEAELKLPDLSSASFVGGIDGRTLLMIGLVVSLLGFVFGLMIYKQLENLPVHQSMRDISELIYETCKTYLTTQGKFLMILEIFIGIIMIIYFGFLRH